MTLSLLFGLAALVSVGFVGCAGREASGDADLNGGADGADGADESLDVPCKTYGVGTNSCGGTCGLYPAPLLSGSGVQCPPCFAPAASDSLSGACPVLGAHCEYLDAPVGGLGASCRCEASGWACGL